MRQNSVLLREVVLWNFPDNEDGYAQERDKLPDINDLQRYACDMKF